MIATKISFLIPSVSLALTRNRGCVEHYFPFSNLYNLSWQTVNCGKVDNWSQKSPLQHGSNPLFPGAELSQIRPSERQHFLGSFGLGIGSQTSEQQTVPLVHGSPD